MINAIDYSIFVYENINAMTKADIVKRVTEATGVEKPIAEEVINVLMGTIRGALESG